MRKELKRPQDAVVAKTELRAYVGQRGSGSGGSAKLPSSRKENKRLAAGVRDIKRFIGDAWSALASITKSRG